MALKIYRTTDRDSIRNMCIRNNFYTRGTNEDYANMLEYVRLYGVMYRDCDLEHIAKDIMEHSDWDKYDADYDERFENVAATILREATYYGVTLIKEGE